MVNFIIFKLTIESTENHVVDKSPISIFPQRGGGGDTRGIRLQPNPNPHELDIASKHWDGKLDSSSGISKLNYITN